MARSLIQSALRALRRGAPEPAEAPATPRPPGPVVWVHADSAARAAPLAALAAAMAAEGDSFHLLMTAPDLPSEAAAAALAAEAGGSLSATLMPAPADHAAAAGAFLRHWRPDILIWSGGQFRPALLTAAMQEIPAGRRFLVDATAATLTAEGRTWLPGAARAPAAAFDQALARDAEAARRLQRLGLPEGRIRITGALAALPPVLTCNDRERRDLIQMLGGRPVWVAAGLARAELPAVALAQRTAIRGAHRLLLVALPRDPADLPAAAAAFAEAGLNVAQRAEGQDPDDTTQVLLADNLAELGLWYRIAPVTFAGATLPGSGGGSRHPFEPASLGSALIHGPETQPHGPAYQRLDRAGAARIVRDGAGLGTTVEALLAPDRTAAMAQAAWEITTEGVEVANLLSEMIRAALDEAAG